MTKRRKHSSLAFRRLTPPTRRSTSNVRLVSGTWEEQSSPVRNRLKPPTSIKYTPSPSPTSTPPTGPNPTHSDVFPSSSPLTNPCIDRPPLRGEYQSDLAPSKRPAELLHKERSLAATPYPMPSSEQSTYAVRQRDLERQTHGIIESGTKLLRYVRLHIYWSL